MNKTVIFGIGLVADVLYEQMEASDDREVVAFTVDSLYKDRDSYHELPVISFEELEQSYPPSDYSLFVAIGNGDLNRPRAQKMEEAKNKGYALPAFVHPNAGLPPSTQYGENCFIMDRALIHPYVKMGADVFVWSGAMLGHHTEVGDHCWFTSCANIGGEVRIGDHCFFAINATVSHSVSIGSECFVGANTLVVQDLKDKGVVISEPSKPIKLDSDRFLKFSNFRSL